MLPESGCKSKKENLKSSCFRYITIYLTFIQNLIMQVLKLKKVDIKFKKHRISRLYDMF